MSKLRASLEYNGPSEKVWNVHTREGDVVGDVVLNKRTSIFSARLYSDPEDRGSRQLAWQGKATDEGAGLETGLLQLERKVKMAMDPLRRKVIRLAHENPDLRPFLLPLLREASALPRELAPWRDPLDWLKSKWSDIDLNHSPTYEPSKGVLGNRESHRQFDVAKWVGEKLFGRQFASEHAGKSLWVTYRDNRNKTLWQEKMAELQDALRSAGLVVKPRLGSEGIEALYVEPDPTRIRQIEVVYPKYLEYLRSQRV